MKPILFNTDMVKAILEGIKTVTRRCMKPQPTWSDLNMRWDWGEIAWWRDNWNAIDSITETNAPYRTGDILYVRETWSELPYGYVYRADDEIPEGWDHEDRWYPSIHMPKEAARIFLRVTDVRVERLQKCGDGWCVDIEKEGVKTPQDPILYVNDDKFHDALRVEMEKLWDNTIKPADLPLYGWDANPWVWVIEFELCEKPEEKV